MGDNAAGIPSLLSGRRKTYKPKHRLYRLPSDSLSSCTMERGLGVRVSLRSWTWGRLGRTSLLRFIVSGDVVHASPSRLMPVVL